MLNKVQGKIWLEDKHKRQASDITNRKSIQSTSGCSVAPCMLIVELFSFLSVFVVAVIVAFRRHG